MGAWVTSIVGVICLGILLDIVLPEGKTTKYIRGAFSLIVILAIVAPIPSLLKKEWKINADVSAISQSEGEIDFDAANTVLAQSYAQKCEQGSERQGHRSRMRYRLRGRRAQKRERENAIET